MFEKLFAKYAAAHVAKHEPVVSLAHIFKGAAPVVTKQAPLSLASVLKAGTSEGASLAWAKRQQNALPDEAKAKVGDPDGRGLIGPNLSMTDYNASVNAKNGDDDVTEATIMARLDPKDAAEIKQLTLRARGEPSSASLFSKDGVYTAERRALHEKVIEHFINKASLEAATPAEGESPKFIVLGGRGGSGKSSFTNGKITEFVAKNFIKLDSDEIKEFLKPPYAGWNAFSVHEESAAIMEKMTDFLISNRKNFIHDATMKSMNVEKDILQMKAAGYTVEGHYMYLPRQDSAMRAQERYLGKDGKRGRLVPARVILDDMKNNEVVFDTLKKYFSKWSAYDNQGDAPILLGRSKK